VTNLRDRIRQIEDLAESGFEIDSDTRELHADLAELEQQGSLSCRTTMTSCKL